MENHASYIMAKCAGITAKKLTLSILESAEANLPYFLLLILREFKHGVMYIIRILIKFY